MQHPTRHAPPIARHLRSFTALAALFVVAACRGESATAPAPEASGAEPVLSASMVMAQSTGESACVVERIIDGDTFVCQGQDRSVRLLGINTPETCQAPYGAQATQALTQLMGPGTSVKLAFDRERQDRYGRTLAYVLRGTTVINWEMVRQGHATNMAVLPNTTFSWIFAATAQYAWLRDRGIWATWPTQSHPEDLSAVRCP